MTFRFNVNTLVLYDDKLSEIQFKIDFSGKFAANILAQVKSVRLHDNWIIVCFLSKILIYSLSPVPKRCFEFETYFNEFPVFDVNGTKNETTVGICSPISGQVQIIHLNSKTKSATPGTSIIAAHNSLVNYIAVSPNGKFVATASRTGTLIRVFETSKSVLVAEFRRGAETAEVYCITFDQTSTRICVTSDTGTIHIFLLLEQNCKSILQPISQYMPVPKYFSCNLNLINL